MQISFRAPQLWRARGIDLVRLLPGKIVDDAPGDLNIEVEDGEELRITVTAPDYSDEANSARQRGPFLRTLFHLLSRWQRAPLSPWGISTGIRPGKLAAPLLPLGEAEAIQRLQQEWLMTHSKAGLLVQTVKNGYPLLTAGGLSIYVSVPFCPSRCHYCSFASLPRDSFRDSLDRYAQEVSSELHQLLQACAMTGQRVNSVYVGGGTPTSLSPVQLHAMLAPVAQLDCEFTVEAGRPDTLTPEHIAVMQQLGVNRVSINAQYPDDDTLATIGRGHTVADFTAALDLAVDSISIVNSDMIIGLPGQTVQGFISSLAYLQQRSVDNITIHALALKRGAELQQHYVQPAQAEEIANQAYSWLKDNTYIPYYLYRQKNIASNLENVGFARRGSECYYNIASIAEAEPVLGAGAGAVSKLVRNGSVTMLSNPRDPNQYFQRRPQLVESKLAWLTTEA